MIPTEGDKTSCCDHIAIDCTAIEPQGGGGTLPITDREVPPNPFAFNRFQNFC